MICKCLEIVFEMGDFKVGEALGGEAEGELMGQLLWKGKWRSAGWSGTDRNDISTGRELTGSFSRL